MCQGRLVLRWRHCSMQSSCWQSNMARGAKSGVRLIHSFIYLPECLRQEALGDQSHRWREPAKVRHEGSIIPLKENTPTFLHSAPFTSQRSKSGAESLGKLRQITGCLCDANTSLWHPNHGTILLQSQQIATRDAVAQRKHLLHVLQLSAIAARLECY